MKRFAWILVASALSITLTGCAKRPPTAAPTPPRPRVLATAPPEAILRRASGLPSTPISSETATAVLI